MTVRDILERVAVRSKGIRAKSVPLWTFLSKRVCVEITPLAGNPLINEDIAFKAARRPQEVFLSRGDIKIRERQNSRENGR